MKTAVFALAALVALTGCKEETLSKGRVAPEIAVLDASGASVRLADAKGKAVLVSFWFTGCGPCAAELPVLDAFVRTHGAENVAVLPINMIDTDDVLRATFRRLEVESLPQLRDSVRITTRRYAVTGAPANFLIDPDGVLVERIDGPLTQASLEAKLLPLARKKAL